MTIEKVALPFKPPMDWQSLLDYYRAHRVAGVEAIDDLSYERVFRIGSQIGFFRICHAAGHHKAELQIGGVDAEHHLAVIQRVRHMFDLDMDPAPIECAFRSQQAFGELWDKHPALRIAKAWDPYESAVKTILGQRVSLSVGRMLAKQLIDEYGETVIHPLTGEERKLFPGAEVLASAGLELVRTTQARRESIKELSALVAEGKLDLVSPSDVGSLRKSLMSIRGIGIWSAEYIALRAIGHADAFPGTDLFLQRTTKAHPEFDVEALRPWRSYAAVYLWKLSAKPAVVTPLKEAV